MPLFYTVREFAELTGLSVPGVHKMIHDGRLPAYRIGTGGAIRIKQEDALASIRPWDAETKTSRGGHHPRKHRVAA